MANGLKCECGGKKTFYAPVCKKCSPKLRAAKTWPRMLSRMTVDEKTGCMILTGSDNGTGYGRVHHAGRAMLGHRASWEIHNGPIPKGLVVCHKCDNPPCFNPQHLFIGTYSDNARDMLAKGRDRHPPTSPKIQGEKHPLAKLTAAQVREIRSRKSEPRKKIASDYGISARYASSIICGTKWKYLESA